MKAQLLIDKDEFNKHVDEVRTSAVTAGMWQAVNMFHNILVAGEDKTKFSESVSEDDRAKWNTVVNSLITKAPIPVKRGRKPRVVE